MMPVQKFEELEWIMASKLMGTKLSMEQATQLMQMIAINSGGQLRVHRGGMPISGDAQRVNKDKSKTIEGKINEPRSNTKRVLRELPSPK